MNPIKIIIKYWQYSLFFLLTLAILLNPGYSLLASQLSSVSGDYSNSQLTMTVLHIALQDGFIDDEVMIQVNGEKVFHQSGINTRFQIGFATSFEVEVQQGKVTVEVMLPSKHQSKSTVLDVFNPTYLGISLTAAGTIELQVSTEPFRYL